MLKWNIKQKGPPCLVMPFYSGHTDKWEYVGAWDNMLPVDRPFGQAADLNIVQFNTIKIEPCSWYKHVFVGLILPVFFMGGSKRDCEGVVQERVNPLFHLIMPCYIREYWSKSNMLPAAHLQVSALCNSIS